MHRPRCRRVLVPILLVVVCGLFVAATVPSASAHTGPGQPASASASAPASTSTRELIPPAPSVERAVHVSWDGWTVAIMCALGTLVAFVRSPRRLVAAALVALLGVIAFESGVHAVHHLDNPRSAARCAVASAAPHMGGTADACTASTPGLLATPDRVVIVEAPTSAARPLSPARGRAPPSVAS
jgi:hypothetical protein